MSMRIEPATPDDVPEITAIYAHHVIHGTATYELEPPDEAEMAERFATVAAAGGPWLVARGDGDELLGFAYATQFRPRSAYRFTCENSVYVRNDRRGEGIGRALLALLLVQAERAGFRQMIAVIGGAEPASRRLHAACGFADAGVLVATGRKHARWLDTLYMQRALGVEADAPPVEEPR
ncbi:MAG: N-acetyltransferase [Sphingomonadales bacterium]|nr:N-acetyltransferase [Sphingomonadales bacterium]